MPLARVSQARYTIIHTRISNAYLINQRTGVANQPAIIELPILRPLDQQMVYATRIAVMNDQDWKSGDFFNVTWRKQPGKVSSDREVKFLIPQEDGIPWQYLIVMGTIDV